ncbi:MAG: xanthine dehydrogenase small subunit [Candidatus Nanopelagicales bacterium]
MTEHVLGAGAASSVVGSRPIRFVHDGGIRSVEGIPSTTTVLAWLREQQARTGTKEGCNEGDCGACTVLVGRLAGSRDDPGGRWVELSAVNSCLAYLPTLDGAALLTVEDLGGDHPAQQALVAEHGSQCGFCTPGFVMSMAATHQRARRTGVTPTHAQIEDDLAGNLCRCTGYRPILAAAHRMLDDPAPGIDTAPLVPLLEQLESDPPLHYGGPPAFHAPRTVADLAATLAAHPDATLLAGGTDVGIWTNKHGRALAGIVWLGAVPELASVEDGPDGLHIGAGVSLEDGWAALTQRWPQLYEMGSRFASRPVREAGTLVGNLANGSPIGDTAPVLIALDASLVLHRAGEERTVPLESFYLDYMRTDLRPGELVRCVVVPPPDPDLRLRAYKVAKRYDSDISAVSAGLALRVRDGAVADARFAFGGMAATVRRAARAERAVVGRPWTEETVHDAQVALADDFVPMTDLRASAGYRARGAAALLERFWLETREVDPVPESALSVWGAS